MDLPFLSEAENENYGPDEAEVLEPYERSSAGYFSWLRYFFILFHFRKYHLLIPDPIKKNRYSIPAILTLLVLLALPMRLYLLLLAVGICIGYIIASPDIEPLEGKDYTLPEGLSIKKLEEYHVTPSCLSPEVEFALDDLLTPLMRDLINPWYVPLCKSGENEFQQCCRSAVNVAIMNFAKMASLKDRDTFSLILFGLAKALIVHVEDYKAFEFSRLGLEKFLNTNLPKHRYHKTFSQEIEHLRQLVALLLKRLFPKQESRSIILNSLMKELISSNAIFPLIEKISDPDFLNEKIIEILRGTPEPIPYVEAGWNLLEIKLFRGRNLPLNLPSATASLYLILHVAGRRIKTRKISDPGMLWNESFRFKISDSVQSRLKVYVQLCKFNYMGQDESLGFAKFSPEFAQLDSNNLQIKAHEWHGIVMKDRSMFEHDRKTPEVLLEVVTVRGGGATPGLFRTQAKGPEIPTRFDTNAATPSQLSGGLTDSLERDHSPALSKADLRDYLQQEYGERGLCCPQKADHRRSDQSPITLDAALQNNELFMEFLDYLNSVKAPPYLQFLMNVDALGQYAAMTLGLGSKDPGLIDRYFKSNALSEKQRDEIKTIKHDAVDVFATHFTDNARYRVPLDPAMQQELQDWVVKSDRIDENGFFAGGPIGPSIFLPAYKWVSGVLEEVYLPKFKQSNNFQEFMDRAQFSTINFTVDDDKLSTYSQDVVYGASNSEAAKMPSINSLNETNENSKKGRSSMKIKKVATEIAITREKISALNEKLESLGSSSSGESVAKRLVKERSRLEAEVSTLLKIIGNIDISKDEDDDVWVNLRNARVRVSLEEELAGESVMDTLWNSTVGSVIGTNQDGRYRIEVFKEQDEASPLSSVVRSYPEFQRLHKRLKKQFFKVGRMNLPGPSEPLLDSSLLKYLELLISDEFICQSELLRQFLTIEDTLDNGGDNSLHLSKKFRDALRSATSLISSDLPTDISTESFYENPHYHTTSELSTFTETNLRNDIGLKGCPPVAAAAEDTAVPIGPNLPIFYTTKKIQQEESSRGGELSSAKIPSEELTDQQVDMIVDIVFSLVMETFDLQEPNQWLRRKLLGLFKQLLKQAYGETLSKLLNEFLDKVASEEAILGYISTIKAALYQDGIFIKDRPPLPPKSEEQKFATMMEARTAFLRRTPEVIQNMAGRYNAVCGMTRVFNCLQQKRFNKALLFACADIILKIYFSD